MAYREEDFFTFCYMTIAPGYRQGGLGKAFVEELIAEARQHQAGSIKIALRESLTENIRFFTGLGFIKTVCFKSSSHYLYGKRQINPRPSESKNRLK